jgi:hypothetical protein
MVQSGAAGIRFEALLLVIPARDARGGNRRIPTPAQPPMPQG